MANRKKGWKVKLEVFVPFDEKSAAAAAAAAEAAVAIAGMDFKQLDIKADVIVLSASTLMTSIEVPAK